MSAIEQINKFTRFKRSQERRERTRYVRTFSARKADNMDNCACRVDFREWESGESKVTRALLCKLRFLCENCAMRNQGKLAVRVEERLLHVLGKRPDLIPVHLTFGVRTGPDLVERLNHLRRCIRMMGEGARRAGASTSHNRKLWELSKVVGAARNIELKRSDRDGLWNVHSHWIALLSDYLDLEKFSDELRHVSGDSFVVHAAKIRPKYQGADPLRSAIAEVCKYPLKFAGLRPSDAWEAHTRLHRRNLFDAIGALRGIRPGDLEQDDGLEIPEGPYRDYVAFWLHDEQRYRVQIESDYLSERLPRKPKPLPSSVGSAQPPGSKRGRV